jgi:uncharacterized membrane protein
MNSNSDTPKLPSKLRTALIFGLCIFIVAAAVDGYSTYAALKGYGSSEFIPLTRKLIEWFGVITGIVILKSFVCVVAAGAVAYAKWESRSKAFAWSVAVGVSVVGITQLIAVAQNFGWIHLPWLFHLGWL